MEQHGYRTAAFHLKVVISDAGSKAEVLSESTVWGIK